MSKAGWYPDPGGQPGLYRYWDGRAWSASVTNNPYTAPPSTGVQSAPPTQGQGGSQPITPGGTFGRPQAPSQQTYGQGPYQPTQAQPSAGARRSRAGLFGIVGVIAVIAVVVALILNIPALNPFNGQNPASNPTADMCPRRKAANETVKPVPGAPGRVKGGKLSFPQLGAPWSAPFEEDRLAFGRDVWQQKVTTEAGVNGKFDWVASILVGELVAGDGFFSPEDGSKIVTKCVLGTFYGDAEVTRTDKVNQATTVGGKAAWITEMHLTFDIPGLKEKGETAIIIIVATGVESSSIFYASIPDSRPELLQDARRVQKQLRVEP